MAITLLPTPPTRQDPINFNVRADEFLGALPTFGTEANSLATDVNNKQVTASNAATTATNAASTATTKAGEALASANAAASSASSANTARLAAEAAYDGFDDRYFGQKTGNPTTDNDGGALIVGALYFRTTAPIGMKVWTGSAWDDAYANLSSKFDKTGGDISGGVNFTGGNVGVGTTTPSKKLVVSVGGEDGLEISPNDLGSGITRLFAFNRGAGSGYRHLRLEGSTIELMPVGGNVLATSGALGYGVGAGGTVVQATSKSTAVTLNKPSGRIAMHNAPLAAGATVAFQLANSLLMTTDGLVINCIGGASSLASYRFSYGVTANGIVAIYVTNETGVSLSETIVLNFQIIKGAIS